MMGYVNVFDSYGRWRFYQGDSVAFSFEERLRYFGHLINRSIAAYKADSRAKLHFIQIHLTKHFSGAERQALASAVRAIEPEAVITFVWINPHHNLRLYNLSTGSDGQIHRALYLENDTNRVYLTTTGSNEFQQPGMGTPIPLQLTIWADPADTTISLRDVSQQILSLTRLNWGSSRNFCQEPITTKFAGDIARLMNRFLEDPSFSVNTALRGVPWFL